MLAIYAYSEMGVQHVRIAQSAGFVRANTYYQSLILHNNAGPLGTAASLHAALAIPNVTLLEAPRANREPETDVCWSYPEIVDGYALPLEGPGLPNTSNRAAFSCSG